MSDTRTQAEAANEADHMAALFRAPASIPHYETGPVTRRTIERNGILWSVTYHAEHDGIGWLVMGCRCHPEEEPDHQFDEGDIVHVRLKVAEDGGDMVKLRADDPGGQAVFWLKRGRILRVERPTTL